MKRNWLLIFLSLYTEVVLGCNIYPLELLHRALLRGPLVTRATSDANQWAGRTTLNSGSATATVSTFQVNSDSLLSFSTQAALVAGYTTMGRTSIASGIATATVSTVAVFSGDVISLSLESPNTITSGEQIRVDSIVGGVSFAIAGMTPVASGAVAMWRIHGKDPVGIKVNTISHGNYFTFGWGDGRARPVNADVLWEIRRTT